MIRQSGFTLVQIMMTIALAGIIGMMASPLTGAIVSDARVTEAEAVLNQAVGRAKSIALRNEKGIIGAATAAAICISTTNSLTVKEGVVGTPPNCSTSDGVVVWTAQLNSKVVIKTSESGVYEATSCLCYSNKGFLAGSTCSSASCATSTTFQIESGNSIELVSIY